MGAAVATPACSYWRIRSRGSFRCSFLIQSHLVYFPLAWVGCSASLVPRLAIALQPAFFGLGVPRNGRLETASEEEELACPWGRM